MQTLTYPFAEEAIRTLKAGDAVSVNGKVWTGRDRFHKHFADGGRLPVDFRDGALYHCGPVVIRDGDGWRVTAAGPTTSSRENAYMPAIIRKYGIRAIIGKGGMGPETAAACRECGCVYLQAIGGAAQILAQAIVRVIRPSFLEEFGSPEAIWQLEVRDFPAIVTMDAQGASLHETIARQSRERLERLTSGL